MIIIRASVGILFANIIVVIQTTHINVHVNKSDHNQIVNSSNSENITINTPIVGADFICYREENFTELVQTIIKQPVRVRSHNWCLEFPPRCSNYKTEIREVIKLQNVTKPRTVEYCCTGYTEITSGNETMCKPVCQGGCGRGICDKPDQCRCNVGYVGRHCTQRCRFGRWGAGCRNVCKCSNGSPCDNRSGACQCSDGWIGEFCDQRCPNGFYGFQCKKQCDCSSSKCDPRTGECFVDEERASSGVTQTPEPEEVNATIATTASTTNSNLRESAMQPIDEVFIIKSGQSNQAVLLHQPPRTDMEASQEPALKNTKVIHVISKWPEMTESQSSRSDSESSSFFHDLAVALAAISAFMLILLVAIVAFIGIYRKNTSQNQAPDIQHQTSKECSSSDRCSSPRILDKPLPDLPTFTQTFLKKDEYYDTPSNNSAINGPTFRYSYTNSCSSSPTFFPSLRRDSLDPIYDEVRYPNRMSSRL